MALKVFNLDHIKLIWSLIKGETKFEEYLRKRGLSKNGKFEDINFFVNDNYYMINEFLAMVSIGLRCRAMKGLFSLTDSDIEKFTDFRKSTVGYFISGNMMMNKNSEIVSQRKTSLELIYDLAIIFDLPFRYLTDTCTKYEMIYSFTEYNTPKIKVLKF